MMIIVDEETGIKISSTSFQYLAGFDNSVFPTMTISNKKEIIQNLLYSLAYENNLSMGGSKINFTNNNAYLNENKGFKIDEYELTANISFNRNNSEYANYRLLDTILHEFFHRYTTVNRDKQTEEFQLNLDGYYGQLVYKTQPTEMGARLFSIKMLKRLNEEFYKDEKLNDFIKLQEKISKKKMKKNLRELDVKVIKTSNMNYL